MNLVIDIGNTTSKIGIFYFNQLIFFKRYSNLILDDLKKVFDLFSIKNSILCSSGKMNENLIAFLNKKSNFLDFNHLTKIPIKNNYASLNTLGLDRLANIVGSNNLASDSCNILSIDTGTCITFNFINAKNEFLGGSICPGIELRFKAMHTFTDKLPLIDFKNANIEAINLIGNDTQKSMLSGVINGVIAELDEMIAHYHNKFDNLRVFMTGGGMHIFEKRIKSKIFAVPNLVIFGLNKILEYNVNKA